MMQHQVKYEPVRIAAQDRISLTEDEQKIFKLLKDFVKEEGLTVQLRVAGGWVRDKLLKLHCKDVDIALDSMMGEDFAGRLCSYMRKHDLQARGVGVIHSNPDKSKHLETATIHIFGQPIDFVNLRAEEYASGSRIPEKVAFGTPLQDALRRDITINSLFYHLQNEEIEDWCGRGLLDLEEGIIRTPLAPETTLLDDPLRLLRIIRFATRYGFAPVPEVIEASLKATVHQAFLSKVSRERVGVEFDKTISGPNGFNGLHFYARLNAFSLLTMRPETINHARLLYVIGAIVIPKLTSEEHRLALICCPLIPYSLGCEGAQEMIRNAFKLPNKDVQDVGRMFKNCELVNKLAVEGSADPVLLGRLVKDIGPNWRLAIRLACTQCAHVNETGELDELAGLHEGLISRIEQLRLGDAWNFTSLLTGNEVRDLFQLKPGKEIGVKLAFLMDWQYAHPAGTKEQAIEYLGSTILL